ncbi:MAG: CHASE2 domain-containing protein, partial [Cyanothece sp. SIO1E1]|nr:CHASE2 domain-containing protein [Cyanothece sp. SIO1E1]
MPTTRASCYRYQTGGSLPFDAPSYVWRQADDDLYQALMRGDFCYVLNSRQMGKSSLRVQTMHRLRTAGVRCGVVDLTALGTQQVTPEQWYASILGDLVNSFQLSISLRQWWRERSHLSTIKRLSDFFRDVLLEEIAAPIVIFIDEIDSILALNFPTDDFFALIRACHDQRPDHPAYQRLTFCLLGVATPSDLIADKARTPFNIGRKIELGGFQIDAAATLAPGLTESVSDAKALLTHILRWTNGQPFLTQKLCQLVLEDFPLPVDADDPLPPCQDIPQLLDNLVQFEIIDRWEFKDDPEHLRTIRDRLLCNPQLAGHLLGSYQQILTGETILADDSQTQIELLLSGLVINQQGVLTVKNRIYQAVFNPKWVAKQLENLRPYAQFLDAWVDSNQQDQSQLLQGATLQHALTWAGDKRLGDLDYRFLGASQALEKQIAEHQLAAEKREREQAEFALEAAREANQILATARKTAKRQAQNLRLGRRWILGSTITVTSCIGLLRLMGWLQGMEWAGLDRFFQARPPTAMDPRIVIITIDESDVQGVGQFPLSDQVLTQALQTLKRHQPRVIGLDVYRDLPVEPGYQALTQLFKTTPNLIGIEKTVGRQVAPPPVLADLGQVGFADQVLDGDGTVRRALLSIRPFNSDLKLSFGLQLALRYLAVEGITPHPRSKQSHQIQLGKTVLTPFQPNDGGYVRADTGGYQIFLNFHGPGEQLPTFSMTDLLTDQIPPEVVHDSVVLIGSTAESVGDLFQTPYSNRIVGPPQQMAGVIIHANIVSQLLSAALDGRTMLRAWPEWVEWGWLLLWSGMGSALGWR